MSLELGTLFMDQAHQQKELLLNYGNDLNRNDTSEYYFQSNMLGTDNA